jgi:hypothetical protein
MLSFLRPTGDALAHWIEVRDGFSEALFVFVNFHRSKKISYACLSSRAPVGWRGARGNGRISL